MKTSYIVFLTLVALIIVGVPSYYTYTVLSSHTHYACDYPNFSKIKNGLTADQVSSLLNIQPSQKRTKTSDEYVFGQAELEPKIKTGWIYTLPTQWEGSMEVYFDSNDIVIGKNCGNA